MTTIKYRAGPVRGVHIHPSRPLLVTGGDDYKVKVWGMSCLGIAMRMLLTLRRYSPSKSSLSFHTPWALRLRSHRDVPSRDAMDRAPSPTQRI